MGYWLEVWRRPGHANFGRVIDDPPVRQGTWHDAMNRVGDGSMQMPSSFGRFNEILLIDKANLSQSASSLVRVWSDVTGEIVGEWLVEGLEPTAAKNDPFTDVFGEGIKKLLSYARTEPFDWDGSATWVPTFPDWIWGGRNLIANPGFEDAGAIPTVYEIFTDATGGTFTLSDGTDTTSALAFNVSASAMETALETEITAITDVLVTGTGAENDPWTIEFVSPPFGVNLAANFGGLTGGTGTITRTQVGGLDPAPAMRSQTISRGVPKEYGAYTAFEVTDAQANTGTYSLLIDPAPVPPRYAGVQWVVNVEPGGLYQASIWVRPTSGTDTYRFVVRAPGGDAGTVGGEGVFIDSDTGGLGGTSFTANVWTEVTIPDIVIPPGVTTIILRFANVNATGNPAPFFVDDVAFREGMAATTVGEIIRVLYEDATINHAGRVVWDDDANPGTPYLTLDFTDTLDSNGNAWDNPELEVKVWQRMNYLQVMQNFADDWGYEWRIVPDDPEVGTWLWQVYNPGTMDDAPDAAILGGASDTHRQLRRFLPATDHMVEGEARISARAGNATLRTALGRIEVSRLGRNLPSLAAAVQAAVGDDDDALPAGSPWSYELVDPQDEPGAAYRLGDTIAVHDPPEADGDARLWDWVLTLAPERATHEVMLEEI